MMRSQSRADSAKKYEWPILLILIESCQELLFILLFFLEIP